MITTQNTIRKCTFRDKNLGRILLWSLKVTFTNENLDVVNNAKFLQTFPNEFEICH